jgi:hypothetical protein
VRGLGKQEWPGLPDNSAMGETALIPVCFHATTMANKVLGRLIDKKCSGIMKINEARSAGKGRVKRQTRINQAEMSC